MAYTNTYKHKTDRKKVSQIVASTALVSDYIDHMKRKRCSANSINPPKKIMFKAFNDSTVYSQTESKRAQEEM